MAVSSEMMYEGTAEFSLLPQGQLTDAHVTEFEADVAEMRQILTVFYTKVVNNVLGVYSKRGGGAAERKQLDADLQNKYGFGLDSVLSDMQANVASHASLAPPARSAANPSAAAADMQANVASHASLAPPARSAANPSAAAADMQANVASHASLAPPARSAANPSAAAADMQANVASHASLAPPARSAANPSAAAAGTGRIDTRNGDDVSTRRRVFA
eukprot:CAMPEP_0173078296 /NCGR_PEP_ID=MMETSP1102-20130122/14002_1 /TAXON_ID=49646 /ORGANISM="Geminigera sp., Strain Caron Lab Isolate" /LENGTH=216 /DNA_ID=CAMNT_0013949477 /DNA_START=187 /DNA_END=837 /DNA_ORIENTATION=-